MNRAIKLTTSSIIGIILLLSSSIEAYARIIFVDDVFENNSEIYEIGSNDDSTIENLALNFGGINSEYVSWNTSAFKISDDITVEGNAYIQGSGIMLDSDNTGPGQDTQIVANQGSDNDGELRYSATNNRWEISNDGQSFEAILTESSMDLDDAYNNFSSNPSTIYIDAAQGQTGGLKFDGSLAIDETVTISNSGNGGTVLVENTGTGISFRVNDEASDTTPFAIDNSGKVGIGTATPTFNFHMFDSTNTAVTKWQVFDDGTNQASILTGTQDPTLVATNANIGSIFLNTNTGILYSKIDDGLTTNWEIGGLSSDLNNALLGTYGIPSDLNRFVTDTDPRLGQNSGAYGETALGTHLNYDNMVLAIDRSVIYYTRIFLPQNTLVEDIGVYTTQSATGKINMGLYSDNNGPYTKLTETGTQTGSTSPTYGFWRYSLSTPYNITDAGFYWLALATSTNPKAATYPSADDRFIPYHVESKANNDTTLPSTATINPVGNTYNLPYIAAFE